jgi:hypothetical protein
MSFDAVHSSQCLTALVRPTPAPAVGWRDRSLSDILKRMRHDGCGGLPGQAELLTGIDGVSSRPVRRIVLLG